MSKERKANYKYELTRHFLDEALSNLDRLESAVLGDGLEASEIADLCNGMWIMKSKTERIYRDLDIKMEIEVDSNGNQPK